MSPRLSLALEPGGLVLPEDGPIRVLLPWAGATDLSALPRDRVQVVQPFKPDFDHFAAQGFDCVTRAEGPCAAALVILPRAKALARGLIAQAAAMTGGMVIVDGAKTDGADSLLREVRKRVPLSGQIAKAHGKLFWFAADGSAFADWLPDSNQLADGFHTAPGVFSADGIDPASRLLAEALPAKLGRGVADLGAGWGYLAREMLTRPGVETLHLVEADRIALDCARLNVTDPRAAFHWADATAWTPPDALDSVVMNPPFHIGRDATPALGRAFIEAAARMLKPSGSLWMVANRHLAYEATLTGCFGEVSEVAGDTRFKVLHAARPLRKRRGA